MSIPFNLPLNSTIMLVAGGIFVLVLFVVVASMGRKSLSGAPAARVSTTGSRNMQGELIAIRPRRLNHSPRSMRRSVKASRAARSRAT